MNKILSGIIVMAVVFTTLQAQAEVRLQPFMTDSMVVQQNSVLKIRGRADSDVKIKASWLKSGVKAKLSKDSTFYAELKTPKAGGPFVIELTDGKGSPKRLCDVFAGEVWLCGGQSNMEMPVGGWGKVMNWEAEKEAARNYPLIRLLQVTKRPSAWPLDDAEVNMGGWRPASPETVENFSSIAYFFARDIQKELGDVPVGVIDCNLGGTPAEAWTSLGAVKTVPGFEGAETVFGSLADNNAETLAAVYDNEMRKWQTKIYAAAEEAEKAFDISLYQTGWETMPIPECWEQTVLPSFDGMVWVQKQVDVPAEFLGKDLTLQLGTIDDNDVTYFNGVKVGETNGHAMMRSYTIPASLVKEGKNLISVRVFDQIAGGGFYGSRDNLFLTDGEQKIPLAGEWRYLPIVNFSQIPAPLNPYDYNTATMLYNAMLHPLKDLSLQGVLWYQGCANVGREKQYETLFPTMIQDWRALFGRPDLPFYFVQLAGYLEPKEVRPDSEWAALREAQKAALKLDNTAMVSAIDLGEPYDIHPKNKQEVARRLAQVALRRNYGHTEIADSAPTPESVSFNGREAEIRFSSQLSAEGKIDGFVVKTRYGWQVAKATLKAPETVVLKADATIQEIKYDWADFPNGNLRGNGLPVVPFQWKNEL